MSAYKDLLGHLMCSTLDLVASAPVSEYPSTLECPRPKPHTFADWLRHLEEQCHPWDGYIFYFGRPNSDSPDDSYDPTRECFHIEGAVESASEEGEDDRERANATPPHNGHPPKPEVAIPRDGERAA